MVSQITAQNDCDSSPRKTEFCSKLSDLYFSLIGTALLEDVWKRLLSDGERERWDSLESAHADCRNAVNLFSKAKGISFYASIIELWRNYNLPDIDYNWLCRELFHFTGERVGPLSFVSSTCDQFMWNSETGILKYQGKLIRKVKASNDSKNIRRVLDVFQEDDWPEQIDNPFPGNPDKEQIKDTLKSLNTGLSTIRFKTAEAGEIIYREYK